MIIPYFYFFTGYFNTFSFGNVCKETTNRSISLSKLFDISRVQTFYKLDISSGNYLRRLPYKLNDFKYFNWLSKSI